MSRSVSGGSAQRVAEACRNCSCRRCSRGTAFSPAVDHAALRAALEPVGERVAVVPGHIVAAQGDVATHCFIVESGVAKLTRVGRGGEETVVDILGPCSIAGASEMLDGAVSPHYLVAVTACTIRRISRAQFTRAIDNHDAAAALIANLAAGQSRSLGQIAALKGDTADLRIIRFLSATCPLERGEVTMELPIDRATLAWWLGIRPESLSRAFRKLRSLGITSELRWIRIASLERLRAAAGERECGESDANAAA